MNTFEQRTGTFRFPGERELRRKLGEAAVEQYLSQGAVWGWYQPDNEPPWIRGIFALCAECGQKWELREVFRPDEEPYHEEMKQIAEEHFFADLKKVCSHIKR